MLAQGITVQRLYTKYKTENPQKPVSRAYFHSVWRDRFASKVRIQKHVCIPIVIFTSISREHKLF